mgnify:CR=1 FL=1
MNRNIVIASVVVLVLIVAGWFLTRPKQTMAPEVTTQTTQAPVSTESATAASGGATVKEVSMVSITAAGFSPKDITVKVGESITWTNDDSANHTVSSNPHPTHTLYPMLNLGMIKPAATKSVMIEKAGKYTYHDHLNPSNTGSITVE